MPRETRRQIIVSGGSEGETRQWMSWCQEAADRATVPTTPLETSPKHSSVEPTPSKIEEARREVEPSGVEPVAKKAAEHTGGGLLSEDYTRYLPKEPAKGIEGLLRFVRSTDKGLRLWREVKRGAEDANLTVFLSKVWSEATLVDFYSIPLSIALAILTSLLFVLSITGAFMTPLAVLTLAMWVMAVMELLPVLSAVQQGTCSGVVVGEVTLPTANSGLIEAALLDISEWHKWTPALNGGAASRLSSTGLVQYRGKQMVEHIIRPRPEGVLPSLMIMHHEQEHCERYTCWALYPQASSASLSVIMHTRGGPGKARGSLTFVREFLSALQLITVVCPRPCPSIPDLGMPRGGSVHAIRRSPGGWVELPLPYGVAGIDSALKTALLHNSEEAVVGRAGGPSEGEDKAMSTLLALSYMFVQSSIYMPRASTAIVNHDSTRALQLVAASIVGSLQRLLCALQSSDAFLATATASSKAVIIAGDTCQCKAVIPRRGGRGGQAAEICWEAVSSNHAHYLVTEEKGGGQWTQRGTMQ
ncbi:hypothetical protein Pmar_PMAR014958 [Perkinsus marinus ATCC 50983]|uniref:Uncharacterized protein n=1 Tax=Perkinsus marinus (strain ATCC 50983 / TXsc) TaxID=423536 RepID=C5LFC5_PERM5|nr:hypothetical protein Pmar_PMAR014958 [Perkinsus marinus ATCC 50983]EER04557.1 hypothetical protein Pmar_PMAR014958 [Perkinsus marinus ATCC 50983]|eukprot:XP_002772741.1 hypothetical protein Pmar_PMAR014958 [Perkinsus marinus ATCC 50983]